MQVDPDSSVGTAATHWLAVAVPTPAHSSLAEPLTYRADQAWPPGTLVRVPLGAREVQTHLIGELVMAELQKLDKVAYIRYASVYRSFEDIDQFKSIVDEVTTPALSPPRKKTPK